VHKEKLHGNFRLESAVLQNEAGTKLIDVAELAIKAGEHVVLLGGNGAGKTTLLRLMSGLLDPSAGQVLLDGVSMTAIDPADRRRAIGYLPQDVALFHGSLRENLNPQNAAISDDEMMDALEKVGLGAYVRANSLGLDLRIAGSGSLSGGQRQA